ncbi:MAG: DUF3383 family protein [Kiritimatiellae bacterium]|nr:DUF3383 family protein [Kiritimatiellia bacterium]
MAIMQERYVRITSSNMGNSAIQERDLNGLLFTIGRGWISSQGAFGTDSILKCYSVDQVRKYFAPNSDEVKFATKYFSYIAPSGGSPASLSIARVKVSSSDAFSDILSYMESGSSGLGWYTSPTKGSVECSLQGNPPNGGAVTLLIGPSSGAAVPKATYTFVSGIRTATNQVLIGENSEETAANFAAVVNGTAGFYGQTASKYVTATVDGAKVTLTSIKAGEENSPFASAGQVEWLSIDPTEGTDGGDYVGSPYTESPAAALSRVNQISNNFGSFAFLPGDVFTDSQMESVLSQNAGYNYKYLASAGILPAAYSDPTKDYDDTSREIEFVEAVQEQNGAVVTRGDGTSAAIPMAIFASVDYGGVNSAPTFMFKQISGEKPTVTSDQVADTLDGIHVNYYGLTQVNGQQIAFYQRGFNLDGEDMAVYCNEVWLKSHIATAIFNLLVSVERVPANSDGEAMLYATISGAAQQGVRNGVIEVGKTFSADQRAKIFQVTGDSEAYQTMQNAGYWLNVSIEQDGSEYKAVYSLVYGKGDAIRFVQGQDILM